MQGVKMKKFLVQIWAYNYHGKMEILAEDNAASIEQSILDKLGEKSVKWDYLGKGAVDPRVKRITYEEVINDPRPIQYEEVLGVRMATRTPERGKHNIRMIEINKKIQDIIKEIVAREFEADTLQTKVNDAKPEVSIAT